MNSQELMDCYNISDGENNQIPESVKFSSFYLQGRVNAVYDIRKKLRSHKCQTEGNPKRPPKVA